MCGCFRFLRLPFGLSCFSDIFQCKIDNLFHDLEAASGNADDMIAWGYKEDSSDKDKCGKQILQRYNEKNLKTNPRKYITRSTRMPFYSFIVSKLDL